MQMTNLAIKESTIVGRPLKVLVQLIKDEIAHGRQAAEEAWKPYEARIGEYLAEARPLVERGSWEPWLKTNFQISVSTANNYIRFAKALPEYESNANRGQFDKPPSISKIVRPDYDFSAEPARAWQGEVRQVLTNRITPGFVERMAQERDNAEKELKLIRDLTIQMIDLGYKILATKLHPDKGGDADAMSRLTRAKNRIKKLNSEEGL